MANRALNSIITGIAAALAFVALSSNANAAARTFSKPHIDGDRIAVCLSNGTSCGKPVADRLCAAQGFERALTFRINRNPTTQGRIRSLDNQILTSSDAHTFDFIKCYKPNEEPATVKFTQPKAGAKAQSFRLAGAQCSEGDDHCTRDAADNWCQQHGFGLGARTYSVKLDLGLDQDTLFGAASASEVDIHSSFETISCKVL